MTSGAEVVLELGSVELTGDLSVPPGAQAIVLFAHGSGSSRRSSRNRAVAAALHESGLGTLLFDLLSDAEEAIDARTAELRFNISLLADRLLGRRAGWGNRTTRGICESDTSGRALERPLLLSRPQKNPGSVPWCRAVEGQTWPGAL